MTITEISVQKRNKKRCNVYIDGNFCCALFVITVMSHGLKVGMEISEEELNTIAFESEKESAQSYAFDYVSKYFKTEKQLREKLLQKGYLPAIVDYVVNKVKEYGYINDENFAKAYLESGKIKKGEKLLKYELKAKGISEDILEDLEISEEEELAVCKKESVKFFQKAEKSRENVQKLYAKLARKGFSFEIIKKAVNFVLKEDLSEEEEFYD